jgi:hypothetical protein
MSVYPNRSGRTFELTGGANRDNIERNKPLKNRTTAAPVQRVVRCRLYATAATLDLATHV